MGGLRKGLITLNQLQTPKELKPTEERNSFFDSIDSMFDNPGESLRKISIVIFKFFVVIFIIISIISLITSLAVGRLLIFLLAVLGAIILLIPIGTTCLLMCGLGDLIAKVNSIDERISQFPDKMDDENSNIK